MSFSTLGSNNFASRHARRVRPRAARRATPSLFSRIANIGGQSSSSRRREQEENARRLLDVPESGEVYLEDLEGTEDYCDVVVPIVPYKELERTPLKRQRDPSPPSPSTRDRVGGVVRSLRRKLSFQSGS